MLNTIDPTTENYSAPNVSSAKVENPCSTPLWLSWWKICLQCGGPGFDPWAGKIPWRRERLPTPVFWSGEFHGLYCPWGRRESDTTEQLSLSLSYRCLSCCSFKLSSGLKFFMIKFGKEKWPWHLWFYYLGNSTQDLEVCSQRMVFLIS